jgi:hypothetical protein
MSRPVPIPPDLPEKIVRLLDGSITDEEFALLDRELAANEAAPAFYVEFVAAYVGLTELGSVVPMPGDAAGKPGLFDTEQLVELLRRSPQPAQKPVALRIEPELSEEEKRRKIESYARRQLEAFLEQQRIEAGPMPPSRPRWDLSATLSQTASMLKGIAHAGVRLVKAAAVVTLSVLIVALVWMWIAVHRPVATVVESVDARWESPVPEQVGLRPQRLRLEQGYARIRLKRGAELIVQAPSTVDLETANRIFMEAGWITARVPVEARGFTVLTPLSSVVDHGTEFGLLVNKESNAEVHVFDGRVGLQSKSGRGPGKPEKELVNGDAATIDGVGQVRQSLAKDRTRLFARTMPSADSFGFPGRRLSLADMVGGGNGLGTGVLGQGLDPSTGNPTETPIALDGLAAGFRPVPALLFIDGVFVPDGGMGPQAIASTGLAFDGFTDTVGVCGGAITDGAVFHARPFQPHGGVLPGHTESEGPSIGMPANAGITFDLEKIRSAMPDMRIERFTGSCGLSLTVRQYTQADAAAASADIRVLVDGRVRWNEIVSARSDDVHEIDVALKHDDRFLTLAVTQTGDYSRGWAMFAEPALELVIP